MCIPIHPATSNPLNRTPLTPNGGSLPWPNCYFHCAQRHLFAVHQINGDTPSKVVLSPREVLRAEEISDPDADEAMELTEELDRARVLQENSGETSSHSQITVASNRSFSLRKSQEIRSSLSNETSRILDGTSDQISSSRMPSFELEDPEELLNAMASMHAILDVRPTVDVWYDLSVVSQVNDPTYFFQNVVDLEA